MRCEKCGGNILKDTEGPYCFQCGRRPSNPAYLPAKKHRNQYIHNRQFEGVLEEEYLIETNEETEKVKLLLRQHPGVRQMLEDVWQSEKLADNLTLRHMVLLDCYSVVAKNDCELLERINTLRYLDRHSLFSFLNTLPRPHGGRRWDTRTIDLAIKLLAGASYQWLLEREIVREKEWHPRWDSRKVRPPAHARLKSARRLFRRALRLLSAVGLDIELRHSAATRALWEDKYKPIALFEKGLIVDVCY